MFASFRISTPFSLVAFSLLVRWLVSQFPHSGQGSPPMYGDYEAQRHWMEVTVNLPVEEWYQNTTNNDLQYWGLDYPPLTAYHMFSLGYISKNMFNSSWTTLHESRGEESYLHKIFMRSTVLIADLIIYIPAILVFFSNIRALPYSCDPSLVNNQNIEVYTAFALLYPGQILIDHGHFQYNCVFMGMVLWSIIFMQIERHIYASILFTMALCYKQMSLYYSLPFFWYIMSLNLRVRPIWIGLFRILFTGVVVLMTVAVIFMPFAIHGDETVLQVVKRVLPFERGLFEDKVANYWFCLSVIYKYRKLYTSFELLKASTLYTLIGSLPSGLHLLYEPTKRNFRYSLATTSLVFFLFSYHVHEKTILLPALPILLLIREHPIAVNWFITISTFSLQPLLIKDGQLIPYAVLMTIHTLVTLDLLRSKLALKRDMSKWIILYISSLVGTLLLSVFAIFIKPPPMYPDIHPTVNALYSCIHFIGFLLYFYFRQLLGESKIPDRIQLIKKTK